MEFSTLATSQIPNLAWSKITSGTPTTLSGYGITDAAPSSHVGSAATSGHTGLGTAAAEDVGAFAPASHVGSTGVAQHNLASGVASSNVAGFMSPAQLDKLAAIEALADVTDATNVNAALSTLGGVSKSISFVDNDLYNHSITIANGIITVWNKTP